MSIHYNLLQVDVDLESLVHNFNKLNRIGGNAIAVVKSDAYGHGLRHVAPALADAGARSMAVGTVSEAVTLRELGFKGEIIALLGPQDKQDDNALLEFDILPFVGQFDQLRRLAALKHESPLPIALKFDTGMSRLGFRHEDTHALVTFLQEHTMLEPRMAASHLATADEPENANFTRLQGERFQAICHDLAPFAPFDACLANSAALLAFPGLRMDAQRPGIALYGANPFHGTPWEEKGLGLRPAMRVSTPVMQVRNLEVGDTVSYGRTFTATRPMRVAVVAAGYADCFSRGLSSKEGGPACVMLHGKRAPLIGRVCMQMTVVDVTGIPQVKPGDRAWILGGEGENAVSCEEIAKWWGTITYEVFCLLGLNPRSYT